MIGLIIVLLLFTISSLIIFVGIFLDFIGYYKRMERNEKHHMDNDEFDYGHNVNHKDYE